ncbi:uncharacterized protein [Arachis hypogaea]|uniref:uncharacterized protein n=1 Tax=Arachis hypogaea TaxID=3818 RepID=UPI003B228BC2
MYYDLKKMFWWPGMKGDVATVISKCLTCQKVKIEHQKPSGMLQPLEIPQWKWKGIAMDFVTDLRRTRSGFDAYESGEASVLGPDLLAETTETIKKIRERILMAQSRQKSYADQRRKPLEFEVGEHVFLRVTPTIGIGRAIKTKKLNPRFIGPFEILRQFGPVPYQVALPPHLSNLHNVRIDDTSVKKLQGKEVSLVNVAWNRAGVEEHTWELESEMRKDYPELFSGSENLE